MEMHSNIQTNTHDVDYRVVIRGQNFTHMHARTFKHNSRIYTHAATFPATKGPQCAVE